MVIRAAQTTSPSQSDADLALPTRPTSPRLAEARLSGAPVSPTSAVAAHAALAHRSPTAAKAAAAAGNASPQERRGSRMAELRFREPDPATSAPAPSEPQPRPVEHTAPSAAPAAPAAPVDTAGHISPQLAHSTAPPATAPPAPAAPSMPQQFLDTLRADGAPVDAAASRPRMPSSASTVADSGDSRRPSRRRGSSVVGGDATFSGLARGRNRAVRSLALRARCVVLGLRLCDGRLCDAKRCCSGRIPAWLRTCAVCYASLPCCAGHGHVVPKVSVP